MRGAGAPIAVSMESSRTETSGIGRRRRVRALAGSALALLAFEAGCRGGGGETAEAAPGLAALSSARRVVEVDLEAWRAAGRDLAALAAERVATGPPRSPAAALWALAGPGLEAWSVAHLAPDGDVVQVFHGSLDVPRLRRALDRDFDLTFDGSTWLVDGVDPDTCAPLPTVAVRIDDRSARLGPPRALRALARGPEGAAPAAWRRFAPGAPLRGLRRGPEDAARMVAAAPGRDGVEVSVAGAEDAQVPAAGDWPEALRDGGPTRAAELAAWMASLAGHREGPVAAARGPGPARFPPVLAERLAGEALVGPSAVPGLLARSAVAAGPFAVRLRGRRILVDRRDRYELELAAESVPLPNLVSPIGVARARLFATRAVSNAGSEWLPRERCGADRNHEGAAFEPTGGRPWQDDAPPAPVPRQRAAKRIRLAPEARLEELERIAGYVELQLPTRTERTVLPPEGGRVEGPGVRVEVTSPAPGELAYRIDGDPRRLLDVRARDDRGDLLATRSVEQPGDDAVWHHRFDGPITAVEVWTVGEEETSRHAFELESPAAWGADFHDFPSRTPGASPPSDRADFERFLAAGDEAPDCAPGTRSEARLGGFALCWLGGRLQEGRLTAEIELLAPGAAFGPFELAGLELRFEGVELADAAGRAVRIELSDRRFARPAPAPDGARRERIELSLPLASLPGVEPAELRALRGTLVHRLPVRLQPLRLDLGRLGNAVEYSNGVSLQWVELTDQRLGVLVTAERERLVGLRARDADGYEVSLRGVSLRAAGTAPGGRPRWRLELEVGARPASLELLYALALDPLEAPFLLAREAPTPAPVADVAP